MSRVQRILGAAADRINPGGLQEEAEALLDDDAFGDALDEVATSEGRSLGEVRAEATSYLKEMAATHADRLTRQWARLGDWFLRAYDILVDEDQLADLRKLDRQSSLGLAFAHRSYLDGMLIPNVMIARRFSPTFTFGGANLDLPLLGAVASRTGVIFIRRKTKDLPVYRLTLRSYIRQLVKHKRNLAWSIEGGRTRTGKLRPPVHGILKYMVDAVDDPRAADVQVVPVSIVYDQLHEVSRMTEEARGGRKSPEDWKWLVRFARLQRDRMGRAYLTVGEPFSLRDRLEELRADDLSTSQAIERIALDISHRLNRATPVTVTAIVSLALLGADRAMTIDEVLETVQPLASYIDARQWPVAGAANLEDRSTIRRALQELVRSQVLTVYEGGTEPVWRIGDDQHLVAAFYRNTVIHILVDRAIGELALLTVSELGPGAEVPPGGPLQVGWEEAKRIRDLLKFEFFFPARAQFEDELRTELRLLADQDPAQLEPDEARRLLVRARPHLAHLVLRPFLDAYLVLADRLAEHGDEPVDEDALLDETLAVGQQWQLQRRVANAESVSLELYRTALALARHRGLLESGPGIGEARQAFRDEIADSVRRVQIVQTLAEQAPPDDAVADGSAGSDR